MKPGAGPFGIFFQIGYVTRDIHRAVAMLVDRMGASCIDLIEDFRDPQGNPVVIRSLSHLTLGDAEIEIIEPRRDPPSIYLDALPVDSAIIGLHHLGYRQPDILTWESAMETIRAEGATIAMEGAVPTARFAYIDTRHLTGHYTEMVYRA